jgi:hypothetical protein
MLLFMPPYCRCHSDMYDVIRLHYDHAATSQLFWLATLSDEILDVVTSKSAVFWNVVLCSPAGCWTAQYHFSQERILHFQHRQFEITTGRKTHERSVEAEVDPTALPFPEVIDIEDVVRHLEVNGAAVRVPVERITLRDEVPDIRLVVEDEVRPLA